MILTITVFLPSTKLAIVLAASSIANSTTSNTWLPGVPKKLPLSDGLVGDGNSLLLRMLLGSSASSDGIEYTTFGIRVNATSAPTMASCSARWETVASKRGVGTRDRLAVSTLGEELIDFEERVNLGLGSCTDSQRTGSQFVRASSSCSPILRQKQIRT